MASVILNLDIMEIRGQLNAPTALTVGKESSMPTV
jgi:hypothetical protein